MQTCELCGWDTRSDTRVCSSCRRAGADQQEVGAPDATQLLSAVLHAAGDDGRPDADGADTSPLILADTPPKRDGTQVVLREVARDAHDTPAPERSERPGTSSIAASLIAALSTPSDLADDTAQRDDAPATQPDDDTAQRDSRPATQPEDGDPTADAEDRASADDTRDGTIGTSDQDVVDDVGDDDTGEIAVTADDTGDGTAASAEDGGDGPAAFEVLQDSDGESQEATDDRPDSDDDPDQATDDRPDSDDDPDQATEPGDEAADLIEPTASTPTAAVEPARARDDGDDEPKTVGQRLRAGFQEMGAWTAVAQLGLLLVALLCVFQVVVLLVVHQFLAQVQTQDAAVDLLAAHARAINVMVPTLVGCALVAVAFAAWHARRGTVEESVSVRRWFGMPLRLWSVAAIAGAVLGVVLLEASTTVEQARQTTLWAIAGCALLGVVALVSPRAIVATPDDRPSSAANDRGGERDDGERRAA